MKLYIIHGWTYTVEPWRNTIQILEDSGIAVEMLHVPGLTTRSQKVWTVEEYAQWADQSIPDGAVALGHSNGGRILLNLLSSKPDKLKHLILLDAAGIYEESKKRDLSRKVSKTLSPLKKIKPLRKVAHKLLGASDYDRAPENMKLTLSNMLDSDKKLDFSKITVPTTIIWGEADTTTPPRQGQKMHELIPGSELIMRARWTHSPYISHPVELARLLDKVMTQITNGTSPARGAGAVGGATSGSGGSTPVSSIATNSIITQAESPQTPLRASRASFTPALGSHPTPLLKGAK